MYAHGSTPLALLGNAVPNTHKKAMWTVQNTPRRWHDDMADVREGFGQ